jgi:hypothetical protein
VLRDAFSTLALGNKEMTNLVESHGVIGSETRFLFYYIALGIEDILYRLWCCYNYTASNPPIVIPSAPHKVHKYSQAVVYYTAGWIIAGMYDRDDVCESIALRMAEFAACHTIMASKAKEDKLPTEILDAKETKHPRRRPSKAFYNFACFLECIYMHNMNVDMMMAYCDGDLLSAIRKAICCNEAVEESFIGLLHVLSEEEDSVDESSKGMSDKLMEFVIRKYANMRGRWFAKAFVGQTHKGSGAVENMSTRNQVAALSDAAKAASKAKVESGSAPAANVASATTTMNDKMEEEIDLCSDDDDTSTAALLLGAGRATAKAIDTMDVDSDASFDALLKDNATARTKTCAMDEDETDDSLDDESYNTLDESYDCGIWDDILDDECYDFSDDEEDDPITEVYETIRIAIESPDFDDSLEGDEEDDNFSDDDAGHC